MERYIAVDNVCAWPNLTAMPDRRIVATIFNQPCHGQWEGDVECWETDGEGRFWKRCGVPAPHEPATIRMNVAAGLARNGDLIVISSGWGGAEFRGCILDSWVCRSSDGGRSWGRAPGFPPTPGDQYIVPFGKIIHLADGGLGVSGYGGKALGGGRAYSAYFLRSRDDGRVWGEHAAIAEGQNETDLLPLEGDSILAASRTSASGCVNLFRSEDGGRSWRFEAQATGPSEHPAHLLRLADGRILLAYGIRHRGCYGVGARLSEDGGKTWYTPMHLVDTEVAWDVGYPSSAQLKDGSILTAYYASGVTAHTRYHMGVVRWRIEELSTRNTKKA
jgi:hypothetical protein